VPYYDDRSFVMADIPGIIEGAHEGKGLGVRFLRHIERNSVLLFMIPADSKDIKKEYKILLNELKQFNPELLTKGRLLAISKCDMLDDEMMKQMKKEIPRVTCVFISSHTQLGLTQLKDKLWEQLNA
jgi:GTP-binding protein